MITDEEILEGQRKLGNKDANEKDVVAFRKFMNNFECNDAETFEEAHEKIRMSMKDVSFELMTSPRELHSEIFSRRYKNLR
jgi:hypothetical protein